MYFKLIARDSVAIFNYMDSKKYNNTKLAIGIGKSIVSFIFLYLFISLGYSLKLQNYIQTFTENHYLVFMIFVFAIGIFSSVLFMPINIYTGYYLGA